MTNAKGIVPGDAVNFRLAEGLTNRKRRVRDIDGDGNVIVQFNSNTRFIVYDREITSITKRGRG